MVQIQKLGPYAAIDLGTNTFHLIIGEMRSEGLKILFKANSPVQLGEKTINSGYISDAAIERALKTLQFFKEKIQEFGVIAYKATATSAVRSSKNGHEFVYLVKEKIGIQIDVISGNEEAKLIFNGIRSSGCLTERSLIMDIGGGSTEFIIADYNNVYWKKSYDMGAARLWQKYFSEDPLPESKFLTLEQQLSKELEELFQQCEILKPSTLIGSAGSFETYLQMLDANEDLTAPCKVINMDAFNRIAAQLRKSTHQERLKINGLIPLRVDMIVAAAMLTKLVLVMTGIQNLKMTTYDLKMGVLNILFKNQTI